MLISWDGSWELQIASLLLFLFDCFLVVMSLTCTTVFWGQTRLAILPLGSCGGWSLFWQNVASTDEQRDLVQWGIDGSISPAPGTWHFVTLPQKLIQLKKHMQIQALNIITIYHWKGDQGVYFHLNYTSLNMHQKISRFQGHYSSFFSEHEGESSPGSDAYA